MLISLFFILRFLFYTFTPADKLSFGGFDNPIRYFDLLFVSLGVLMGAESVKRKSTIKRLKSLFFITPLFLIVPTVAAELTVGIPNISNDFWVFFLDIIFLLYTVIFSFTLGMDFDTSGKSKTELKYFTGVTWIFWFYSIQPMVNSIGFNILHSVPFLWAAIRFRPLPQKRK